MSEDEKNNKLACPSCGEDVKVHWKRCPACDTLLPGTRTPTPSPLNSTIESGETILVQGDDAGSKSISFADRYELFEEIGRGGMGVVFRARHLDLDRIVAVKRILPESAS